MMATATNLGFARIGPNRELKKIIEQFWAGKVSSAELLQSARDIESANWRLQAEAGIEHVPAGDFSLYDHVLDTALYTGVIPDRFRKRSSAKQADKDLDLYFAMARGTAASDGNSSEVHALEMTKWFDTNYHYLVPEFTRDQEFLPGKNTVLEAYQRTKGQGVNARPVILGPVSFLMLGKMKDGAAAKLELLPRLLPVYEQLLRELARAGADWVQIDEPCLVLDLDAETAKAFADSFQVLSRIDSNLRLMVVTYFASLGENLEIVLNTPVHGLHLDLVRAPEQLDALLAHTPEQLTVSLGLVDGRNIWRTDLEGAISLAEHAAESLSLDRVFVAPSCSLLHAPVDLNSETRLDPTIKEWLAFGRQKLEEVSLITRALNEGRQAIESEIKYNRELLDRRAGSPGIRNPAVRQRLTAITPDQLQRGANFSTRKRAQQAVTPLPLFPTTTIGSFPQTAELRRQRILHRKGEISTEQYETFLKSEIEKAIRIQEELDLDVLVHGEPERNDMVEYFGEALAGFAFTENGWVQSYGTRCVKPPIIYGDVFRRGPITVDWWRYAQSLTKRPVKGMLTGPVTILEWSFVRNDQLRKDTCFQIALAIRDEVTDLEAAGCRIIQIDEPAIREGMPLRRSQRAEYLQWAVDAFRLAASGVRDTTQIHTHMCYSEFNEMIDSIAAMDADVISIESARSQMELLDAFSANQYPNDIGPGIYDIHSPRVPSAPEMVSLLEAAQRSIDARQLWVNPDCGLKTRQWQEVRPALANMVAAAVQLRRQMT
jgi:5-methyltetrahydropteroyltriglutamate--homocysteine methyltransferase